MYYSRILFVVSRTISVFSVARVNPWSSNQTAHLIYWFYPLPAPSRSRVIITSAISQRYLPHLFLFFPSTHRLVGIQVLPFSKQSLLITIYLLLFSSIHPSHPCTPVWAFPSSTPRDHFLDQNGDLLYCFSCPQVFQSASFLHPLSSKPHH